MTQQVQQNDLQYYAQRTDVNGPAMTWAMFAVGYLEVGDAATAATYFEQGYTNNLNGPYQVWSEVRGGGGAANFITGAGASRLCACVRVCADGVLTGVVVRGFPAVRVGWVWGRAPVGCRPEGACCRPHACVGAMTGVAAGSSCWARVCHPA